MNMLAHMEPLLDVRDLSISFGQAAVVSGVSFQMRPGEILGIVGESGSGKSVTCRAIMGLLPSTVRIGGSLQWAGREVAALAPEAWRALRGREIAMIFQNPSSHLDPLKRIGSQVAAPMRRHLSLSRREAEARVVELLEAVGITEPHKSARSYPHQFSGGMKQRAMIAAAIGSGPKMLIADEPTTALDVTVQARILQLLKKLNQERGLAVILVSHDLGVIVDICTRVIVMRGGEAVEQGPVSEVMARPRHPYTRLLIDSQPGRRLSTTEVGREPEGQPHLRIRGLTVTFARRSSLLGGPDEFRALEAIDLSVARGETVGIVGESGSGKTTLARAIVRLNRPVAGSIELDGENALALTGKRLGTFRRKVQMVFQNPYDSLNPRLSALEAVAEPFWRHRLTNRRAAIAQARELLDMVELPASLTERRPRQLSGGQCQRVGLARALALEPELLIADEITSALDVTTQAQILDLLSRLQRQRALTLLYISHDLSVVASFCRRVYVFKDGRIVESGQASHVLTRPDHPYTKQLVASLAGLQSQHSRLAQPGIPSHAP